MLQLIEKYTADGDAETTLTLPLHLRIKSRQRVTLDNGRDAGLLLPRGTRLRDGDLLCSADGYRVRVIAADESLSSVTSDDPLQLARACYHLGNRHVALQIRPGRVSYLHDHVLDEMLRGLGLSIEVAPGPFEPEPGAYGGSAAQGHSHGGGHGHHHH